MAFKTKTFVNNSPPSLDAEDLNLIKNEMNNVYVTTGIAVDDAQANQMVRGVSIYAVAGGFCTDSGTANSYSLSPVGSMVLPSTYVIGMRVSFIPSNTSTGASTVNVGSLGAKNIKTTYGTDLVLGDIIKGRKIDLFYDGTNFVLPESNGIPTGFYGESAYPVSPAGWLFANGQAISRVTYAGLYSVIGVMYGSGNGSTTFNVPDLRGYFKRGWNNASGNDLDAASRTNRGDGTTGDNVGTKQDDQFKSHNHARGDSGGTGGGSSTYGRAFGSWYTDNTGGNETRPKNISVYPLIKT